MTTYYSRADGTAANKATAIGPVTDASACMSRTVFNAETFVDNDIIIFSNRGGDFTSSIYLPSGGVDNKITYRGEEGYEPDFTAGFNQNSKANVIIENMFSTGPDTGYGTGFQFKGVGVAGVVCNNLSATKWGQCCAVGAEATDTVSVEFNDCNFTGLELSDETFTSHGDVTIVYNRGVITASGTDGPYNWVNSPTCTFNDVTFENKNHVADVLKNDGSYCNMVFNRCIFIEPVGKTDLGPDFSTGDTVVFKNCIFFNLTDGAYYLIFYTAVASAKIYNCTFIGNGTQSTIIIFNQALNIIFKNNILLNGGGTKAFYGNNGTIAYNLFYGSGEASGTNTVTTNPDLDSNGRIQSAESSAVGAGIGPDSDTDVPENDIDGNIRSGIITDLGAYLWVPPKSSASNLLDGVVKIITASTDNLDGKSIIQSVATAVFDGKGAVKSTALDLLDGKGIVKTNTTDLFDGKSIISSTATNNFDGKVIVNAEGFGNNLLDGKTIIKSVATNHLDGLIYIGSIADNTLDGKAIIKSNVELNLDGKATIKDIASDLLDGSATIQTSVANIVDGKVVITDAVIGLLDGKAIIQDDATILLDGKVFLSSGSETDVLDGKIIILVSIVGKVSVTFSMKTPSATFTIK